MSPGADRPPWLRRSSRTTSSPKGIVVQHRRSATRQTIGEEVLTDIPARRVLDRSRTDLPADQLARSSKPVLRSNLSAVAGLLQEALEFLQAAMSGVVWPSQRSNAGNSQRAIRIMDRDAQALVVRRFPFPRPDWGDLAGGSHPGPRGRGGGIAGAEMRDQAFP